jgi:hypothetical protein
MVKGEARRQRRRRFLEQPVILQPDQAIIEEPLQLLAVVAIVVFGEVGIETSAFRYILSVMDNSRSIEIPRRDIFQYHSILT